MTDPTVAERILDAMHKATYRKGGDQQDRRKRRAAIITTALAETRRECWEEYTKQLNLIGGLCGHPDAVEACRLIAKKCQELLRRSRAQEGT